MIEIDPEAVYDNLRDANVARGIEWSNGANDGTQFYAVELFGEVGECLNVVKKIARERLGMVGSRATLHDLGEEIADVVICLDLLAISYDLPNVYVPNVHVDYPMLQAAVAIGRSTGQVMGWVERLEGDLVFNGGYRKETLEDLSTALDTVLMFTNDLAVENGLDLREIVVAKFNKTSEKYGLSTRMSLNAEIT